ncbi:MAG TPA: lipopolysaccharide transport periplasmic protein LptA [Usitatibacteraceae bacterium]|nr:lipopolysaccharide transport periplasmic protein LptA [Usitatibacteraceae bacterium]
MRAHATRLVVHTLRLVLAAALAGAISAHAERGDREKEIQVLADRLSADDAKKEAVYEGNVIVTQGSMRITSARIVVREDAQGYRTYIATGAPVTFRQKRDKVDDWIDGSAARAEFDDRNDILKLFNGAKLKSSQGELAGDFISYDRGKEFFEVTGAAPGAPAGAGSRVRATIIPQKKGVDGKPAPAAEAPPVNLKPDKRPGTGGEP